MPIELPPSVAIRFLDRKDGAEYQRLRLESLQQNASAFLTLHDTEAQLKQELFTNHLVNSYHPPYFGFLGIFIDELLVGYAQVSDSVFEKQRHIADIYNVYISPTFRKRGLALLLFRFIFDLLKHSNHIERVFLTCTASNTSALNFYDKLGFERFGIRHNAIKWQGVYDDQIELVKVL
jgi:ribosomal protein S18 acetylase RimI-like enzyme